MLWHTSKIISLSAGHEFVALGWVLEQASPAIARTLAAIPDASAAAVVIPDVDGVPPDRLYRLFGLAVEYANSDNLAMEAKEALDLWSVAAVLQVVFDIRLYNFFIA